MPKYKAVLGVTVVTALTGLFVERGRAGPHYVDPCLYSTLCRGLVEHFDFEEPSDWPRFGAFGTQLYEPHGANVSSVTSKGGFGFATSFSGSTSSFLWRSYTPGPSGYWTIGFWFRPLLIGSSGLKQSILSWDAPGTTNLKERGPDIYLESNGTNLRLCLSVIEVESDAQKTACTGYTIGTTSWKLGVVGQSNFFDGKNQIFVSLDGATPTTTTTSYYTRPGAIGHMRLGGRPYVGPSTGYNLNNSDQPYQGYLDSLDFWVGALSPAEISLLYNGGTGQIYSTTYGYGTE